MPSWQLSVVSSGDSIVVRVAHSKPTGVHALAAMVHALSHQGLPVVLCLHGEALDLTTCELGASVTRKLSDMMLVSLVCCASVNAAGLDALASLSALTVGSVTALSRQTG